MNQRSAAGRKRTPEPSAMAHLSPARGLAKTAESQQQVPPAQASAAFAVSHPEDALERDADRIANQVLTMGDQGPQSAPVVSKASPDRADSADASRDESGVAPQQDRDYEAATSTVDEVLRTDGKPLNESIRAAMEPRFGHSFSTVRVHTDSRAADSARALDAQAYTVGDDIVFAQDRYAPDTSEGTHLIAHELAHVVQQSALPTGAGNQAARMVQRAAKIIPQPGWGNTILSDNSNIWFNPHADLEIGGAVAGGTWFPRAASDGNEEELLVAKGTTAGLVRMYVHMGWFKNIWSGNQTGSAEAMVEAPFKVSPEGKIEWQGTRAIGSSLGSGASLVVPVPAATAGDTVTVTPTINGMGTVGDTSTSTINISPGGLGGSKAEGRTLTSPQGGVASRAYSIKLKVEPPDAPTILQSVEEVKFAPASSKIAEGGERNIVSFYKGLPAHVQKSIEAGTLEVRLEGHASTTQPGPANRVLSRERAQKVQEILRDIAGSNAKFVLYALGEYFAGTPDQVEDELERRVDISLSYPKDPPPATTPAPGAPKTP